MGLTTTATRRSARRGRPVALAALAALTLLAGTACGGGGGPDPDAKATPPAGAPRGTAEPEGRSGPALPQLPASLTGQKLAWKPCTAPTRAQGGDGKPPKPLPDGTSWQCASFKAPLDYAHPDGRTIPIALIRARTKAAEAAKGGTAGGTSRIGSLVFNFGGPGDSGVTSLPTSAATFEGLRSRYDLVSFDPRGVGASAGVRCRDDAELEAAANVDSTPDDAAEERAFLKDATTFGAGCARRAGALLPHAGTADAARDLDLMRHLLGDAKLHYFGFSYGTQLGGTYAHLFPRRVGRAVLDAVVDPSADAVTHAFGQASGFQRALNNYLTDCAKQGRDCPVGGGPQQGTRTLAAFLARLDTKPLPTSGTRRLTQTQALTGITLPLYSKDMWPHLTIALQEALRRHTGTGLLALADVYNNRDERGHYGTQSHSQRAVSCADTSARPTLAEAKAQLPRFRAASPVFGPMLAWDTAGWCANWPVAGAARTPQVAAEGAAPILVVGTTGDPATPYEGSRTMARALGRGVGIHVTYQGEGHGAYPTGNPCLTRTVNAYLLNGKVPKSGTTCR
ncbi:alpha/beta hydrolase [Streptomyces sp. NPDC003077]|uniref:alpha/beta hydrolase n=1 Tax=Streptomyces sp. NPDC003077 TaxID=3154443 RepID=UPI0033B3F954